MWGLAATPIGCKDTVIGSRVVTHSTELLFLHFFYSVGQYHCHGKLSRGHELRNERLTSADLDILFCQGFHETMGLFSSPSHGHGGIPRVHLLIHGDLAIPSRVK